MPQDLTHDLNTELSPSEEAAYQDWVKTQGMENPTYDYDLRGAWKEMMSGGAQRSSNAHFTDKYKKPNHPTFSDQSQYSNMFVKGGHWADIPIPQRQEFTPSAYNLQNMSTEELQKYFDAVERENKLILKGE